MGLSTRVNTDWLLATLKENRQQHNVVFTKAMEGFRVFARQTLEENLTRLTAGKLPNRYIQFDVPELHDRDYERAISMVGRHVGDTIELDERTYQQLVLDQWDWKDAWVATSSRYTGAAAVAEG